MAEYFIVDPEKIKESLSEIWGRPLIVDHHDDPIPSTGFLRWLAGERVNRRELFTIEPLGRGIPIQGEIVSGNRRASDGKASVLRPFERLEVRVWKQIESSGLCIPKGMYTQHWEGGAYQHPRFLERKGIIWREMSVENEERMKQNLSPELFRSSLEYLPQHPTALVY